MKGPDRERVYPSEQDSYDMAVSKTPDSAVERKRAQRLKIARKLYQELVAQDPNRLIDLRDGRCKLVARHDPRPEQMLPEIGSNLLS